jgi:hypothetical protein
MTYEIQPEWVHIAYAETSQFREVYGFAGSSGMVNLEGIRFVPKGKASKTLAVFMHPATTLQLLPVPQALAKAGVHVLCAGPRPGRLHPPRKGEVGLRQDRALRLVGRRLALALLPGAG